MFYIHAGGTFACGASMELTCSYLEAAPASGTNAWTDVQLVFSGNTEDWLPSNGALGYGLKNTTDFVAQNSTAGKAITSARAYRGPNNLSDWFLPSQEELQYLYVKKDVVGGLQAGIYKASSGCCTRRISGVDFTSGAVSQHVFKYESHYVRPIRAFAVQGDLTVTFNSQGGTPVLDAVTTSGGALAEAPTAPTRSGYRFLGWFVASSGGAAITFPYTHGQTSNFSLYAQWVQSSLDGLGSVTKIGTITTTDGIGNTFAANTESSSVSVTYPAGGLPANTVLDFYLVNDMTRAQNLVPAGGGYVVSLVAAWVAADGTVPLMADGKPLSMTITNATIEAGAKVYAIVGGVVSLLGEASADGSVTISITEDPEIVVVNPAAVPTTSTTSTTAAPSTPSPTTSTTAAPSTPSPTTTTTAAPSTPSPTTTVPPASSPSPVTATPTTTAPSPVTTPPAAEQLKVDEIESTPSVALGAPGIVQPGGRVLISYGGFVAGSKVDAYIASTPMFLGSTTTDAQGRIELSLAIPRGIEGEHSIVLFEPSTGRLVRQVIVVAPLALPVTGATDPTDRPVTIALLLLVFGALAASGASSHRRRNGWQHGWREIDDFLT